MATIHTGHVGLGKKLKKESGYTVIDVTVKSADTEIGKLFAPDAGLLWAYKAGDVSEREYAIRYLSKLERLPSKLVTLLKERYDTLVLTCYCGRDKFCHRHLLKRWLVNRHGLISGGEITNDQVTVTYVPKFRILSFKDALHSGVEKKFFKDRIKEGTLTIHRGIRLPGLIGDMEYVNTLTEQMQDSKIPHVHIVFSDFVYDWANKNHVANELGFKTGSVIWCPFRTTELETLKETVSNAGYELTYTVELLPDKLDISAVMDTLYQEAVSEL